MHFHALRNLCNLSPRTSGFGMLACSGKVQGRRHTHPRFGGPEVVSTAGKFQPILINVNLKKSKI